MKVIQSAFHMKSLSVSIALVFVVLQMFAQTGLATGLHTQHQTATPVVRSNKLHIDYINQFKNIAIKEMHRTGIPASITLAQAILESGGGESEVAKLANNHFGIKCGANWAGKIYEKLDDDKDANGNPVKSCYRKYNKAEESFYDHSEFLCDPAKSARYGFLFHLGKTDYKAWARGLESAGYASGKGYADKLIELIERYSLFQYDVSPKDASDSVKIAAANRIGYINRVKVVFSRPNEHLEDIARIFRVDTEKLAKYNDLGYSPGFTLQPNTRIFIEEKRKKWRGRLMYHVVQESQTMFDVSQMYGIRLDELLKRNGLQRGQEPAIGEPIRLRGRPLFGKTTTLIYKTKTDGD